MFRFTIRDVLWLTVVVALAVGWWVHARQFVRLASAGQSAAQRLAEMERILEPYGYERLETSEGSLMVLKSLPHPTEVRRARRTGTPLTK